MVYLRKPRPSFYFEAKTKTGYQQVCTLTSDKKTAQRMEHVWAELAAVRAWDLLMPIIEDLKKPQSQRTRTVGWLLDLWTDTKGNLAEMRRRAEDKDIEPMVAEWAGVMETQVGADWAAHALVHVRALIPEGSPRLLSTVTAEWLTTALAAYPGKRNTRRKVHSSWSVFFDYLTTTKRLFAANPMLAVARPSVERAPIAFYDAVTVKRIVDWQPTPERRALLALIYGTGADLSPAITIERDDINAATKEVRIRGTKTAYRDRVVRVSDAQWPTFWKHAKTVLSGRIFPATFNRWTTSDWHREAVGIPVLNEKGKKVGETGLALKKKLPLRKARHFFAVRLLESGAAIRVVAEQLGSDERTVLLHYGPWITSAEDRARAEKLAKEYETKKRRAK